MKNKTIHPLIAMAFLAIIISVLLASCGSSGSTSTQSSGATNSTTLDGQTLMNERCSVCHSTGRITSSRMTASQWTSLVDQMVNAGAQLNNDEKQVLVDYLAANYK